MRDTLASSPGMAKSPPPYAHRPPLNTRDPLSEPTAGRRVLAALAQMVPELVHKSGKYKGTINKKAVESMIGAAYTSVDAWETGAAQIPEPQYLRRAHELTGYSIHDLQEGRVVGPVRILSTVEERTAVLRDIKATHEERGAWGEHESSPAGRHQDVTRVYITAFVESYREARVQKRTHEKAMTLAWQAAVTASADEVAKAEGRAPVGSRDK